MALLLTLCHVEAIEIFSRKLDTTGGLPDNNVRSLAQDSKGCLWMGTPDGLYRFDGYFFTTYLYNRDGNTRLLNNNHITGCYSLADGRMLFREQGGMLSVFDVHQNRFVDLPAEEKKHLFENVHRRVANSEALVPYRNVLAAGGDYINDNLGNTIVLDQTGQIWFIDRKTRETIRMKVYDERLFPLVSSHKYKVMTSERKGLIWVSTNGCGITVYDRSTHEQQHIGAASGLISTDYIQDICLDGKDNLWVADEFHGLVYLATAQHKPDVRLLLPDSRELRANQVFIMHWLPDSTLLVANTKGDVFTADASLSLKPLMTQTDMHSFCIDKDGGMWIGSRRKGFRSSNGIWHEHHDTDPLSPSTNNIATMLCDRSGRIWAGCEGGRLELILMKDGNQTQVRHFLPEGISPITLVEGHDGTIWVGARCGLFSFRPDELLADRGNYHQHLTAEDTQQSHVNSVYEDRHHHLWVGTNGDGLYHSADGGKTFRHLTMNDGLISNNVQSMIMVGDTMLWVATKKGITCYDTRDGSCQYIYNEYNLQQNYYAENSVCHLPDGRLAFGTNQGIVMFRRDVSLRPNGGDEDASNTSLRITDLLINGVSVSQMGDDCPLSVSPDDAGQLSLAHDQNSITLRFSAFYYSTTSGTRYTYWLEGYDRQWSEVTTYSFANYKNLPPGRYVFHVKAFDNRSSSNAERTLTILVRHPWWQMWWAYLIYIVVAAVITLLVYRQLSTIYRLRRRISLEQQLTEFKLQFFTNISHEFRTPLTIIRGAMDHIRSAGDVPAALRQPISSMQRSTDRMLRLVNQLLEFRKMQNGKLRLALEETDIVAFVKDICQNFSDVAENKKISYTFLPSVKSYNMYIDRQHVDKIVYNLLSNAFKYTPKGGSIDVRGKVGDGLSLSITDTGVGIPKAKQPELFQRFMQSTFSNDSIGIGLHLSKALVEAHHGEISFQENEPQGSVFTVVLPTDKSVYQPEDFLQESQLEAVAPSTALPAYQEVTSAPMNDRLVLVVEDDGDVAAFLRQTLGKYFETEQAIDGSDALEKVGNHLPDLIVTDVMMPVMDGYELTRRLRKNPSTQGIPIVLLTALDSDEKRLKGIEQGADAYITKPFDAQLLIATCRQLIEQRDRLRQSFADTPSTRTSAPPEIITDERDKHLLDVMNLWLSDHIANPSLSVDDVAAAMGYGRSVFFRKVKALTGQTPSDYIRTLRMNRAAEMLREETVSVAEVAYKVGISEPHYFTKVFKLQFGISPKKYQQGKTKSEES